MTQGSASATFSTGRRGAGPQVPGSLLLPAPYAYRSPFRHPDGSYDWKTELDYGWELVDRELQVADAALQGIGMLIPAQARARGHWHACWWRPSCPPAACSPFRTAI